jgi:hypothetical protein
VPGRIDPPQMPPRQEGGDEQLSFDCGDKIRLELGDILRADIREATVIYVASLCFSGDFMRVLAGTHTQDIETRLRRMSYAVLCRSSIYLVERLLFFGFEQHLCMQTDVWHVARRKASLRSAPSTRRSHPAEIPGGLAEFR